MDAARPGGGHADAQAAGGLGIAAGREGRRFFVPHLDELDLVLILTQRLEEAVDAVAGEAEDYLYAPVDQSLEQHVGHRLCHIRASISLQAKDDRTQPKEVKTDHEHGTA